MSVSSCLSSTTGVLIASGIHRPAGRQLRRPSPGEMMKIYVSHGPDRRHCRDVPSQFGASREPDHRRVPLCATPHKRVTFPPVPWAAGLQRHRIRPTAGRRAPRSTASASGVGRPASSLRTSPGSSAERRPARFRRPHQNADRRRRRLRMHRQDGHVAERRLQRPQHIGETVGPPDQGQRAARAQQPAAVPTQREQSASGPRMASRRAGSGESRCRAGSLNGGFISTRSTVSAPAPRPRSARRRCGIEHDGAHPVGEPLRSRVLGRQRRQRRVDLDQRHRDVGNARREREAGRADAGAEIDDAARLRAPASPPPAGSHRGRRDDRAAAA